MSLSASSTRQVHTVLGGGIRYETAELFLSTIPNFELKQKGRILHLFTEIYNAFMQEIQEALDERQNNIDSLLVHNQGNTTLGEPFAFETQFDTDICPVDLSSKSIDNSLPLPNEVENNISNETVPLLTVTNERENNRESSEMHYSHRQKSDWTSTKDMNPVKQEVVTPPKSKRRRSKTSTKSKQTPCSSSRPSLRQMTMTQLFDPVESPQSTTNSTPIKQEPETPEDDAVMFMPESLIGLAQPSESILDNENEQDTIFNLMSPADEINTSNTQPRKRKSMSSPIQNGDIWEQRTTTDEEENIQNDAILQSPYSSIESEELLYACPMCRNYWLGLPEELRHKEGLTCRHRQRPVVHTPEHFWSLGIPSTQTCIQRGYGGVLPPEKPIERPRRPRRRQHQRRLQEQQQENDEIDDDDDED